MQVISVHSVYPETLLSSLIVVARTSKTMLNNSVQQCWTLHPNAKEYTFFSSAHGTFSKIDDFLGHKSNLSKFKKIETVSSIFFNHNGMRLDINYKKKTVKKKGGGDGGLNNMLLNNQQVTEEIKREIKNFLEKNDNENTTIQNL